MQKNFIKVALFFFPIFFSETILTPVYGQIDLNKFSRKLNAEINNVLKPKKNQRVQVDRNIQSKTVIEQNEILSSTIDLSGKWRGKCQQDIMKNWEFTLNLNVEKNIVKGTAELKNSGGTVKYNISGNVINNTITLFEDEVTEEIGWNHWCKKDYIGKISIRDKKPFIDGQYENKDLLYFRDKKIEKGPFGCRGKFEISKVDEKEELEKLLKIEAKAKNNIFTKDKDENIFIRNAITFFGNNYSKNWHYKVIKSSLNYIVLSRDSKGYFTVVSGKFLQETNDGKHTFPDSAEVILYFSEGMPYRISYPTEKYMPDQFASAAGVEGQLTFTDSQLEKMRLLNNIFDQKKNVEFEKNRLLSLKTVTALQSKIYPNVNCNSCIVRNKDAKIETYTVQDEDLNGRSFEREKTYLDQTVVIKNNCNKKVVIVGIKKLYDVKKGIYYEDNPLYFDALENKEFSLNGIGALLGMFIDVDLKKIDPIYDDTKNEIGYTQFLRIICSK